MILHRVRLSFSTILVLALGHLEVEKDLVEMDGPDRGWGGGHFGLFVTPPADSPPCRVPGLGVWFYWSRECERTVPALSQVQNNSGMSKTMLETM